MMMTLNGTNVAPLSTADSAVLQNVTADLLSSVTSGAVSITQPQVCSGTAITESFLEACCSRVRNNSAETVCSGEPGGLPSAFLPGKTTRQVALLKLCNAGSVLRQH